MFGRRVRRHRSGRYSLRIDDQERLLLEHLIPQLRELLMATGPSGAVPDAARRLFPVAYVDEENLEAEYQSLMRDDLLRHRLEQLELLEETLSRDQVTEEQLDAWIGSVNDLRLVLGTRLDVSEEDPPVLDPTDPNSAPYAVYLYLGDLLGELVAARMD